MDFLQDLSTLLLGGILAALAAVIVAAGAKLAGTADKLADATGWGEASVGAVLLGGSTSMPGIVASITAASTGHPDLAISNAIGGIAVQTFWLAIADMFYKRANLEHAAADPTNLFQATVLVTMLSLPLAAAASPVDVDLFGFVSPFSVVLVVGYAISVRAAGQIRLSPMWRPRQTDETKNEADDDSAGRSEIPRLATWFAGLALITAVAGYTLTETAIVLSERTGISETAVGGLITGVITSLPELVTSIAAVRRGALNLAVGGIIGGNAFDVLFLAFADASYAGEGTLYSHFTTTHELVVVTSIIMTSVLLMGLVLRQKEGGKIGFESWLVLILYALMAVAMATTGAA